MAKLNISIGAGHGGKDSGATVWVTPDVHGSDADTAFLFCEADFTYEIALLTAARITHGYEAVKANMIRQHKLQTMSLDERGRISLSQDADLVIELHVNAVPDCNAHGAITFHWPGNECGKAVAEAIARAFPVPLFSGRVEASTPEGWPRVRNCLAVHEATAILVEMGFCTNPKDLRALLSMPVQLGISTAIMSGIDTFCILAAQAKAAA